MTHSANIIEVFGSLQGEGLYVGDPMTFVRLGGCSMRCRFCDTPQALAHSDTCRIETPPGSMHFDEIENPVSATALNEMLRSFDDETISVTGGEPLEQADFLEQWLPSQAQRRRILLETNGIHHEGLGRIISSIHIISMDIKLPSSTGVRPVWNEHAAFLKRAIASRKELYAKIVISATTTDQDIQRAIDLISQANKYITVIIQPASRTLTFHNGLSEDRLQSVERLCGAYLPNVRITPQMHKEWHIL